MNEIDKSILIKILENHEWQVNNLACTRTGDERKLTLLSDYLTFLEEKLFGEWLPCTEELDKDSTEYKEAFEKLDETDKANAQIEYKEWLNEIEVALGMINTRDSRPVVEQFMDVRPLE